MNQPIAGWRRLAGALAACLLAVLVLGPALDSLVCETCPDEAAAHAMGASEHAREAPGQHSEREGLCVHGHIHQVSAAAPATLLVAVSASIEPQIYDLALGSPPVVGRHFQLIRPPRA